MPWPCNQSAGRMRSIHRPWRRRFDRPGRWSFHWARRGLSTGLGGSLSTGRWDFQLAPGVVGASQPSPYEVKMGSSVY